MLELLLPQKLNDSFKKGISLKNLFKKKIFEFKIKVLKPRLYAFYEANEALLETLTSEELHALNFQKRKEILAHAVNHTEFYKQKYNKVGLDPANLKNEAEFLELPLLTRDEITANFESLSVKNIAKRKSLRVTTSGTTDIPLTILHDKRVPMAPLQWRLLKWWGIAPYENKAFIYRYPRSFFKRIVNTLMWWPTKRIFLAGGEMTEKRVKRFIRSFNKIKPSLLQGYVDLVYEIAIYIEAHNLKIHMPKAVWVTSGPLTEGQRRFIQKTFKAPVYNQYGSTELPYVAAEFRMREGLHIMHDMVFVECLDRNNNPVPNGKMGKLVITDLNNYVFPLIRYEIGDFGRLLGNSSPYGLNLPLMDSVVGRLSGKIKAPSGIEIGSDILTSLFDNHFDSIQTYQFLQAEDYSVILNYVARKGKIVEPLVSIVIEDLRIKLNGEVDIFARQVEKIEKPNGKALLVISKLEA